MKIEILYLDNTYEILDTSTLTGSTFANKETSCVMTKFHFNFAEFLNTNKPSNLNLYIYYYRANNDKGTSITNSKFLNELLFYDNDQCIHENPDEELVKKLNKELPYGSLESGCWITLIPLVNKPRLNKFIIDGKEKITRNETGNLVIEN